jgi:hypothetical protein
VVAGDIPGTHPRRPPRGGGRPESPARGKGEERAPAAQSPYLIQASSHLEILTLKLRLLLELKHGSATTIFRIQEATAEVGRMLGGWLRSLNTP